MDAQAHEARMANLAAQQRQAQERAERRVLTWLRARPVLGGSPRDLALNCANQCGLEVDEVTPVILGGGRR